MNGGAEPQRMPWGFLFQMTAVASTMALLKLSWDVVQDHCLEVLGEHQGRLGLDSRLPTMSRSST